MNNVEFTKMHGAGNDFVMIDNRRRTFSKDNSRLIREMCDRHFGIGADGLILLDFKGPESIDVQYFNSDGFSAEMCGNGARCALGFLKSLTGWQGKNKMRVWDEEYDGHIQKNGAYRVYWKNDFEGRLFKDAENAADSFDPEMFFINTGVPHLIIPVKYELENINVQLWGKLFRQGGQFGPDGTNVNFVKISQGDIYIRTYERGVESETLACGTGAVAAGLWASKVKKLEMPASVHAAGGDLIVGINGAHDKIYLEGPAQIVFSGTYKYEQNKS